MRTKKIFDWWAGVLGIPSGIRADTTVYKADTDLITADNG
jgi:hypothetical protein